MVTHAVLTGSGATGESLDRWLSQGYNLLFFVSILLVLAGASAFANDGVLASIALSFGPLVGLFVSGNMGFPREPTLVQYWGAAVEGGLLYGIPIGVGGYLLGRGPARLYERRTRQYGNDAGGPSRGED